MIEPHELRDLRDALDLYQSATAAYERRIAISAYRDAADPETVGALLDRYVADLPTVADLTDISLQLRHQADRVDSYGANLPPPETAGIVAVIAITGEQLKRSGPMAFTLQTGQEVDLSVAYTDREGNEAQVESQAWTSSDDTILTVTDNGDGTAVAAATGPVGTGQVTLTADARFGDDVVEIRGVLDVDVVAAEAVTAVITPGEPRDSGGAPA